MQEWHLQLKDNFKKLYLQYFIDKTLMMMVMMMMMMMIMMMMMMMMMMMINHKIVILYEIKAIH